MVAENLVGEGFARVLRDDLEHADELRPLLELAALARRMYADVPGAPGGACERSRAVPVHEFFIPGGDVYRQ
jgi:hypothetical protein